MFPHFNYLPMRKYTNDLPKIDRRPVKEEIKRKIRNDMKAGMSGLAISRKYSVSPLTVYNTTRERAEK